MCGDGSLILEAVLPALEAVDVRLVHGFVKVRRANEVGEVVFLREARLASR